MMIVGPVGTRPHQVIPRFPEFHRGWISRVNRTSSTTVATGFLFAPANIAVAQWFAATERFNLEQFIA